MGCDIHISVEEKHKDKWIDANLYYYDECCGELSLHLADPYKGRYYLLFGILAGVRNSDIKNIIPPSGLPSDACEKTIENFRDWGCNAHTPSWLTLSELEDIKKYFQEFGDEVSMLAVDEFISNIMNYLKVRFYEHELKDFNNYRIVFWFDN